MLYGKLSCYNTIVYDLISSSAASPKLNSSTMSFLISNEWIQDAIRDYILDVKSAGYELASETAKAVEVMDALPLWCDWNGGVALRPDGELIGFLWDEPQLAKIESDPHYRFLACVVGAEKYPELACLSPERTAADRDCPSCNGSGVPVGLEELGIASKGSIRCYCGGAGWLPSNVPDCPGS